MHPNLQKKLQLISEVRGVCGTASQSEKSKPQVLKSAWDSHVDQNNQYFTGKHMEEPQKLNTVIFVTFTCALQINTVYVVLGSVIQNPPTLFCHLDQWL